MDDRALKYSGGYTSLPASHSPGSVPAVIDDQQKALPFGEANLQTFPPNNAQGSMWEYQPPVLDDGPSTKPSSSNEDSGQASNNWKGYLSIASYRPYFNVDSYDVAERILLSLYPHHGDFLTKISANPDLYGTVWIPTTLLFLAATLGNYAAYLSFRPSSTEKQWVYDINYVNVAALVFYGYTCLVPLGCYFLLMYLGVASSIVQLWCLYGYSMFVFIPASFLAVLPIGILRWLIFLLAGAESAVFVALNILSHVRNQTEKWTIPVVSAFVIQLGLAFVIKFCFYA